MKKAFTMIELIFVIVVIGILAAVIMPRTGSNKLHEAATQVLSHIRYTQHLAMVDDKFDPNDTNYNPNGCGTLHPGKWYLSLWRIRLHSLNNLSEYSVFSDKNRCGSIDITGIIEPAIDPLSREMIYNVDLTKLYGITSITSTCDDGNLDIFFDNLGRPYVNSVSTGVTPPYSNLLTQDCNLTMSSTEGNVVITVHPETGYACILNDDGDCI